MFDKIKTVFKSKWQEVYYPQLFYIGKKIEIESQHIDYILHPIDYKTGKPIKSLIVQRLMSKLGQRKDMFWKSEFSTTGV